MPYTWNVIELEPCGFVPEFKSEFHVQTNDLFSSIKFEITMNKERKRSSRTV
jgi:hypothetical protein